MPPSKIADATVSLNFVGIDPESTYLFPSRSHLALSAFDSIPCATSAGREAAVLKSLGA